MFHLRNGQANLTHGTRDTQQRFHTQDVIEGPATVKGFWTRTYQSFRKHHKSRLS